MIKFAYAYKAAYKLTFANLSVANFVIIVWK